MTIQDILNAVTTTIANFIKAINHDYKTSFPEEFPPNTPLATFWNTLIKVRRGNGEGTNFSAEGVLDMFPFNFGKNLKDTPLTFKVKITVTGLPDLQDSA